MGKKIGRALARVGAGGAVVGLASVLAAGVMAAAPRQSSAATTSTTAAARPSGPHLHQATAATPAAIAPHRTPTRELPVTAPPETKSPRQARAASQPGSPPMVLPGWTPMGPALKALTSPPPAGRRPVANPVSYPGGSAGTDISQYQCADIPSVPAAVAVVQVTGGALNNPPNPCYVQEAAWAGAHLTAYIYLNGLPNPAPPESRLGPAWRCARTSLICRAYDFGFVWADHWVAYSRHHSVNPKLWWLDVEPGSGWASPAVNDGVIRGAADGLRSQGVTVGIYSTSYQWATIAGSLTLPGVPLWIPGAGNLRGGGFTAMAYCGSAGQNFAGGHLVMVQWGYTGDFPGAYQGPDSPYDLDYVCPGGPWRGH